MGDAQSTPGAALLASRGFGGDKAGVLVPEDEVDGKSKEQVRAELREKCIPKPLRMRSGGPTGYEGNTTIGAPAAALGSLPENGARRFPTSPAVYQASSPRAPPGVPIDVPRDQAAKTELTQMITKDMQNHGLGEQEFGSGIQRGDMPNIYATAHTLAAQKLQRDYDPMLAVTAQSMANRVQPLSKYEGLASETPALIAPPAQSYVASPPAPRTQSYSQTPEVGQGRGSMTPGLPLVAGSAQRGQSPTRDRPLAQGSSFSRGQSPTRDRPIAQGASFSQPAVQQRGQSPRPDRPLVQGASASFSQPTVQQRGQSPPRGRPLVQGTSASFSQPAVQQRGQSPTRDMPSMTGSASMRTLSPKAALLGISQAPPVSITTGPEVVSASVTMPAVQPARANSTGNYQNLLQDCLQVLAEPAATTTQVPTSSLSQKDSLGRRAEGKQIQHSLEHPEMTFGQILSCQSPRVVSETRHPRVVSETRRISETASGFDRASAGGPAMSPRIISETLYPPETVSSFDRASPSAGAQTLATKNYTPMPAGITRMQSGSLQVPIGGSRSYTPQPLSGSLQVPASGSRSYISKSASGSLRTPVGSLSYRPEPVSASLSYQTKPLSGSLRMPAATSLGYRPPPSTSLPLTASQSYTPQPVSGLSASDTISYTPKPVSGSLPVSAAPSGSCTPNPGYRSLQMPTAGGSVGCLVGPVAGGSVSCPPGTVSAYPQIPAGGSRQLPAASPLVDMLFKPGPSSTSLPMPNATSGSMQLPRAASLSYTPKPTSGSMRLPGGPSLSYTPEPRTRSLGFSRSTSLNYQPETVQGTSSQVALASLPRDITFLQTDINSMAANGSTSLPGGSVKVLPQTLERNTTIPPMVALPAAGTSSPLTSPRGISNFQSDITKWKQEQEMNDATKRWQTRSRSQPPVHCHTFPRPAPPLAGSMQVAQPLPSAVASTMPTESSSPRSLLSMVRNELYSRGVDADRLPTPQHSQSMKVPIGGTTSSQGFASTRSQSYVAAPQVAERSSAARSYGSWSALSPRAQQREENGIQRIQRDENGDVQGIQRMRAAYSRLMDSQKHLNKVFGS